MGSRVRCDSHVRDPAARRPTSSGSSALPHSCSQVSCGRARRPTRSSSHRPRRRATKSSRRTQIASSCSGGSSWPGSVPGELGPHGCRWRSCRRPAPTLDEQKLALARYMTAVGTDSVETAVAESGSRAVRSGPGGRPDHARLRLRGCGVGPHRSARAGSSSLPCRGAWPGDGLVPHVGPLTLRGPVGVRQEGQEAEARLGAHVRTRSGHQLDRRGSRDRQPAAGRHRRPGGARDPLACRRRCSLRR